MTADAARFARVRALVDAALEHPAAARASWLASTTGATPDDIREAEALLQACLRAEAEAFLESPDPQLVADALADWSAAASATDLDPGTLIAGQYVVQGIAGRGGMATVYRAFDNRHERVVALKLLHAEARDPAASERFAAEIRLTARLQHPGIVPLFDSGILDRRHWFVMPFIEGESLATHLRRDGRRPVAEAVRLVIAVADALAYAHRQGVVHRDIKPGNILLQDGRPMLADFGIALAGGETADTSRIGTPGYMSPEQQRGDGPIDSRSDLFALGCVLFELLTGRLPFAPTRAVSGSDVSPPYAVPPLRAERPDVPAAVAACVTRALALDPAARPSDAAQFAADLATALRRSQRRVVPVLLAGSLGVAGLFWALGRPAPPERVVRFVLPENAASPVGDGGGVLLPDGRSIVFASGDSGRRQVFVRPVNALAARPIAGTAGAVRVFVSPDGRHIGFLDEQDQLKTAPITGGTARRLASVFRFASADWSPSGPIIFWRFDKQDLAWVAPTGGEVRPLTRVDPAAEEAGHSAPRVLDDGRLVAFIVRSRSGGPSTLGGELAVVALDTSRVEPSPHVRLGIQGVSVLGLLDGWLLYLPVGGRAIEAIRFDARARRVRGAPIRVLVEERSGIGVASLAKDGTLLYTRRATATVPVLRLPDGREEPLPAPPGSTVMNPRVSADGQHVLLQVSSDSGTDAWDVDLRRRAGRMRTQIGRVTVPTWLPGDRGFVYLEFTSAGAFWARASGDSSAARRLFSSPGAFAPEVVRSRDLLVYQKLLDGRWSIWAAALRNDATPRLLVGDSVAASLPAVSPDGRWLAFVRRDTSGDRIWVRALEGGPACPVSSGVATEPRWLPNGRGLIVRAAGRLRRIGIRVGPRDTLPTAFSETDLGPDDFAGQMPHTNFDVLPDGERLVLVRTSTEARAQSVVVLHWRSELRQLLRLAA